MSRPLVSVITPTWQRASLLAETVEHVREQTYRPLEHIVVSDGPDQAVRAIVAAERGYPGVSVRPIELGRNWSSVLPNGFGVAPLTVGMLLARGEYQMWLCDDERMASDHIASLVDSLESSGAGFAYSRVRMHWVGQPLEQGWEIGTDPPRWGQITNFLYRTELLASAMPAWDGHPVDWTLPQSWIAGGASWAFTGRTTLSHRADR